MSDSLESCSFSLKDGTRSTLTYKNKLNASIEVCARCDYAHQCRVIESLEGRGYVHDSCPYYLEHVIS